MADDEISENRIAQNWGIRKRQMRTWLTKRIMKLTPKTKQVMHIKKSN